MAKASWLTLVLLLITCTGLWAQTNLSGKITDANGAPIPNASLTVKGTGIGTTCASDGSFSLTVPQGKTTVVVSSLGFKAKEFSVTGNVLNASLEAAGSEKLDEVVVIGFGTKIKKDLTGSIAKVKGSDIQNAAFNRGRTENCV